MPRPPLTPPNLITSARLLAAPALAVAGWAGRDTLFLVVFLGVAGTDWLDGHLARARDEETVFGARMDTIADAVMYTSLVGGLVWLKGSPFVAAWPWMTAAAAVWVLSWAASIVRFGADMGRRGELRAAFDRDPQLWAMTST